MSAGYKETLVKKFNTAHCLAKSKRPISNYIELLELQEKNREKTLQIFIIAAKNALTLLNTLSMSLEKS